MSPAFSLNHTWAGPTRLFTISNALGWAAIATDDCEYLRRAKKRWMIIIFPAALNLAPLRDLRAAFKTPRDPFRPTISLPLAPKPISIVFANNDSCLLVAHVNGIISVYDTSPLRQPVSVSRVVCRLILADALADYPHIHQSASPIHPLQRTCKKRSAQSLRSSRCCCRVEREPIEWNAPRNAQCQYGRLESSFNVGCEGT